MSLQDKGSGMPSLLNAGGASVVGSGFGRPVGKQPDPQRTAKIKVIGSAIAIVAALVLLYIQFTGPSEGDNQHLASRRVMIDADTGEVVEGFVLQAGDRMPFLNPRTGKRSLYQAEFCYWNKDGTAKLKGTPVLLNDLVDKPGPTLCPDCGRKVVRLNPMPPEELMKQAKEAAKGR